MYAEVIGDPVEHSRSPVMHSEWLRRAGIDAEFRKTFVAPHELKGWLDVRRRDPNWRGACVTMPHKETLFDLVDASSMWAASARAVNLVIPVGEASVKRKVTGYNTDVKALFAEMSEPIEWLENVTIFGAGGTARAAMVAIRMACASGYCSPTVTIHSRDPIRAQEAADECNIDNVILKSWLDAVNEADLLINATPLVEGFPPILCQPRMVVDYVYAGSPDLIPAAVRRGVRSLSGVDLLIRQGTFAFEKLFGVPADTDEHIRSLIVADIQREQREQSMQRTRPIAA